MNRYLIILSIFSFMAAGCNKEASGVANNPSSWVSVYAVVSDAPQFNFFLNEVNVAASVSFGSYTLYNRIDTGMVKLKVQSYARDISIDTNFFVSVNQYYSLFLTGLVKSIKPVILHDSLPQKKQDSCGLRFFVLSPGVSDIDLHFFKSDSTLNKTGWANRSYSDDITNDSINTFRKFAAGTYSFYVISEANIKDTIAKFTNKSFSDSANYTLMLEGVYDKATNDTTLLLGTRLH